MSDFSRRTVVRGAAWTVPVVAVATQAPAFAVSPPPYVPPTVNLRGACANTGASQKGCGVIKTIEVPLIVSNPTSNPIQFQITGMYTVNTGTAPTPTTPGAYKGVTGIYTTLCNKVSLSEAAACPDGEANGTITVPAGANNLQFIIVSAVTGNSSTFSARVEYRLLSADCTEIFADVVAEGAIASNNCL